MIRLLIVDDHPATAIGLGELLGREPDIEVVGVAGDVERALQLVGELAPAVLLCDIQLQDEPGGFEILRKLSHESGPRVILFSSFDYPAFRQRAVELGAAGYLLKTAGVGEIVDAIRRVGAGGSAFDATAMRDAAGALLPPSDRELKVIDLVRSGWSNDEIGVRLGVSARGVESAIRRLFVRYGLLSRTELVTLAERQGWLALTRRAGDA
ncbi:MAG: DNA-binding response regulator [Anaerolinea sp.]|nr:DNA-binding response regulator [Anaerolinea sp.]